MKGVIKQKKVIWKQTNIAKPIRKVKIQGKFDSFSLKISNFEFKYVNTTIIKQTATPKSQNPIIRT